MRAAKILIVAAALLLPNLSYGGLVYSGLLDLGGTGHGNVETVLVLDDNQAGCIDWNGTADTWNGSNCSIAPSSPSTQNQSATSTIAIMGWNGPEDIGVVFNPNEPGSAPTINLNQMELLLLGADGTKLFSATLNNTSFNPFDSTDSGGGNSGFLFELDYAQQLAILGTTFFSSSSNRVGLGAATSLAGGGDDSFFLVDLQREFPIPPSEIPEPDTSVLIVTGLGILFVVRHRRMRRRSC